MKIFTDKERDSVASLIEKGVPVKEIAEIFKAGKTSINYVKQIVEAAKTGDEERLQYLKRTHRPLYDWAVRKFEIKITPIAEPSKTEMKTELPKVEAVEQPTYNNDKILIDLLAQLVKTGQETNELLKKLL